ADPTPVWKANGDSPAQRSRYLRHSGLVTLRREDLLMSVNVADIGVNGFGGHKHNDQLALTLCWGDEEFLIDPGTLCYTKDEPERNRLRSSAAHSTVTLSGREANRFIPGYMFALKRDGSPRVTAWLSTEELDLLRAEHDCYGRLKGAPAVARTVYFDKRLCFWLIRDQVIPAGGPAPDSPGWLSSLITGERAVEISDSGAVLRGAKSEERHIKLTVFTQSVEVFGEKFISAPSYGVESVGTRIMFCPRQGQTDLIWGIFPYPVAGKREITGDLLREKLRLLEWPDDNCAFPPGQLNADLQLQSESRGRT
ncbi:MAG: heparinase II/III-family protein, partial [Candidatus Zixiibacteriota bacterium]